jgi:hypothetical protein
MVLSVAETVRQSWINWALESYQKHQEQYQLYDDYYAGEQPTPYSTDRWKEAFEETFEGFADNWCQVVVDAAYQRLEILGWTCDNRAIAREAEKVWDESHIDIEAEDLHKQSFIKGDGYVLVWPNPDAEKVDFYYNDALDMTVHYDPKNKRRILRAAKKWELEDGDVRLNLYHPDRIEQFIVPKDRAEIALLSGFQVPGEQLPQGWLRFDEDIPNPYGIVPVFHFKNRPSGSTHGMSELKTVMPIQNSVNKVLMDMMIGSEFAGFPQKWMAGGGHPKDGWRAGANRVWATTDPNAKFGQFDQVDLDPLNKYVEMLVGHIAKTTQTPMHYLRTSGDMPSGEALKTAESGLIRKCKKVQGTWGHTWGHAMAFAVTIRRELEGKPIDDINEEMGEHIDHGAFATLKPVWRSPETRHDLEQAQTAQLKSILGVPLEQLWSEHFGYTEEQIENFKKQNKVIAASALAQLITQTGQGAPGVTGTLGDLLKLPAGASLEGMDISQVLSLLSKGQTAQTTAGEATTRPQPNTRPPASPTRRSTGFKD